MLERISELEGAAELLPPSREASVVRTKLQEARLAEQERLRVHTTAHPVGAQAEVELALERGRRGAVEAVAG